MIEAALAYAARGLRVFPCRGKFPLTEHGCHEATTDPDKVRAFWTKSPHANVAVATGSGFAVIDCDPRHGGDESLARLALEHGRLVTVKCRTPRGGLHFWFRTPVGEVIGNSAVRLQAAFGPGLDVRGEGGYALVPPSVSALGGAYAWETRTPLATMPAWLVGLTRKPEPPPRATVEPRTLTAGQDGTAYGLAALQRESEAVRHAPEGTRNHRLNASAFALGGLVAGGELARGIVEDELTAAAAASGLGSIEIRKTLLSGLTTGLAHPRGATRAA